MYCSVCNQKWTILAPKCQSSDINKRLCENCNVEAGILANLSLGFKFVTATHTHHSADINLQQNSNAIASTNQHDTTDIQNNPESSYNDKQQQTSNTEISSRSSDKPHQKGQPDPKDAHETNIVTNIQTKNNNNVKQKIQISLMMMKIMMMTAVIMKVVSIMKI